METEKEQPETLEKDQELGMRAVRIFLEEVVNGIECYR